MHIQVQKQSVFTKCVIYILFTVIYFSILFVFPHIARTDPNCTQWHMNCPLRGFEPATIKFHVRILNSLTPGHDRNLPGL